MNKILKIVLLSFIGISTLGGCNDINSSNNNTSTITSGSSNSISYDSYISVDNNDESVTINQTFNEGDETVYKGIKYKFNNNHFNVIGATQDIEEIATIVAYINEYPVISIEFPGLNSNKFVGISLPNTLISIGEFAFHGCINLQSIIIPEGVISIGKNAFNMCQELRNIILPSTLENLGESAISRCYKLRNIEINENNNNYKTIKGNLYSKDGKILIQYAAGKKDTSFVIPEGVETIYDYTFQYCLYLKNITLSSTIKSIGTTILNCSTLTDIKVNENNKYYKAIEGNLYSKDGKTLIQYASGKQDTSFVIKEGVLNIGPWAFTMCINLQNITLPSTLESIGTEAFAGCISISSIVIPMSVTSIGNNIFGGCTLINIYCEASSKAEGWDENWNLNRVVAGQLVYFPTYYAGEWEYVDGIPVSINK